MKKIVSVAALGMLVAAAIGLGIWAFMSPADKLKETVSTSSNSYHNQHDMSKPNVYDTDFAQKMILFAEQSQGINSELIGKSQNPQLKALATQVLKENNTAEIKYGDLLKSLGKDYKNLSDYPQVDGQYPSYPGLASLKTVSEYKQKQGSAHDSEYIRLMIAQHKGVLETIETYDKKMRYGKMVELLNETKSVYTKNLTEFNKLS